MNSAPFRFIVVTVTIHRVRRQICHHHHHWGVAMSWSLLVNPNEKLFELPAHVAYLFPERENSVVLCSAFDRRGLYLAIGYSDGAVVIWDMMTTGVATSLWHENEEPVQSVAWDHRSRHLLTTTLNSSSVFLWTFDDAKNGGRVRENLSSRDREASATCSKDLPPRLFSWPCTEISYHRHCLHETNPNAVASFLSSACLDETTKATPPKTEPYSDEAVEITDAHMHCSRSGCFALCAKNAPPSLVIVSGWGGFGSRSGGAGRTSRDSSNDSSSSDDRSSSKMVGIEKRREDRVRALPGDSDSRHFPMILVGSDEKETNETAETSSSSKSAKRTKKPTWKNPCVSFLPRHPDVVLGSQMWEQGCFSGDSEYVVACGRVDGAICIWNIAGRVIRKLPSESSKCVGVVWHPRRPIVAATNQAGHVSVWTKEYASQWTAFAPNFTPLDRNETYVEREDEFDIWVEEACDEKSAGHEEKKDALQTEPRNPSRSVTVDIFTRTAAFSSDDEDEDFYFPVTPDSGSSVVSEEDEDCGLESEDASKKKNEADSSRALGTTVTKKEGKQEKKKQINMSKTKTTNSSRKRKRQKKRGGASRGRGRRNRGRGSTRGGRGGHGRGTRGGIPTHSSSATTTETTAAKKKWGRVETKGETTRRIPRCYPAGQL
eukprot:g5301.t1